MSRRTAFAAALLALPMLSLLALPASAQQPVLTDSQTTKIEIGSSQVMATPEMWFYLQEQQRHDDPAQAVRRNAEARGAQRRARIAARKWYGLSGGRPSAHRTVFAPMYDTPWNRAWVRTVLLPYGPVYMPAYETLSR